jgi:hypothetical protein
MPTVSETPGGRLDTTPEIEFLICGSPTDAFYSQIAFFRLSLDRLGRQGRAARLVAVLGAGHCPPLPARWVPHFERIEVHYADAADFRRQPSLAASDMRYTLLTPGCRCSCLCDADTTLLRPLPADFLDELARHPAVCGVIAHYPFPVEVSTGGAGSAEGLYPGMPQDEAWDRVGEAIIGRPPARSFRYTLLESDADTRCPFYVNYGLLAGPADLLRRLHRLLVRLQPRLEGLLASYYVGQIAIALAVDEGRLPVRALPMRFNFPNDRTADRLYPGELDQVVLLHYLRHVAFDRHRLFADPRAFAALFSTDLAGSDGTFRDHVWRVTGGRYPFGPAD